MKLIGSLLLVGGFLVAAFATALHVDGTEWSLFLPAAAAAVAGVWTLKRQARGQATSEHVLRSNRAALTESLSNIVTTLDDIIRAGAAIDVERLRDEIDLRLRDDLRRFVEARQSLVHLFSLQTYADIMSEFAAGERYLNRVWSASADAYDGEARRYLEKAAAQFREANRQLQSAGD